MSIALTLHGTVTQWALFYACLSFPVVLFLVALTWLICPPKSDWALFIWPMLIGWIVAALLAWLATSGQRFWQGLVLIGVVCTAEGLAMGGVAMVVKKLIPKFKTTANRGVNKPSPPGD